MEKEHNNERECIDFGWMILPQRINFQLADISVSENAQHALFIRLSFIEALKIEILLQFKVIGLVMMWMSRANIPKRMIIVSTVHTHTHTHICVRCVSISSRYHAVILSLPARLFIYDIYTYISFIFIWVLILRGEGGSSRAKAM